MSFKKDKKIIDDLLEDLEFRHLVESDIGFVQKVQVLWDKNEINFYGSKGAKRIKIDETLATLRGNPPTPRSMTQ